VPQTKTIDTTVIRYTQQTLKMPISDELEALRQSSRVKTESTRLSTAASALYTPQQLEELRKAKLTKEKQSKLEAERAWRSGATVNNKVGDLNDLLGNGMYGRLMNEHRRKVREAQKHLHEWKGSHRGKQGGKVDDEVSNVDNDEDGEKIDNEENEQQEDESTIINNAVEMLPDHVVEALKAKYETDSIVEALTKALQEEESGELSKVVMSPVSKKGEEGSNDNTSLPAQYEELEEQEDEEEVEQQQQYTEEDQPNNEEEQVNSEEAAEALEEEKPIEEVREKIENLSINDAVVEEPANSMAAVGDAEIEEPADATATIDDEEVEEPAETTAAINDAEVEEPMKTIATPEQKRSSTKISVQDDLDCTEQTKLFYNKHADELIAKINQDGDALTPTALRDSFLNYLHEEAHPVTKKTSDSISSTIIDLGCGHGRDTLHFTTLGHHVLAVDYSYAMLHHAKTIAPHAHYLNMDMRMLKNLLIDQSVDGIWSHSSLSHLPKEDLESLLRGLYVSIKVGGVLYFSLKVGTHDQIGQAGEVVEPDTRYTPIDNEEDICKLYSYYTSSEVVELLSKTGWEVIKIGEYDQRDKSEYPTHSLLYVFATRRKD